MEIDQMLIEALSDSKIPIASEEIWNPLVWAATHHEQILKITGKLPCGQEEWDRLRHSLVAENRYELYFAMLCSDETLHSQAQGTATGTKPPIKEKARKDRAAGQMLAFFRWCDEEDLQALIQNEPAIDLFRLSYLALAVGYKSLAMAIIASMGSGRINEGGAVLQRYGNQKKRLFKRWVAEFYQKQPLSKEKRRLAKRFVRHLPQLLGTETVKWP